MRKIFLFSAVVSNLVFAGDNNSANYFINYQGYMLEANGSRANGIKPVTFSVYDDNLSGSKVWTEKKDVKFVNGIYSTKLGDTNDSIKSLNFKQSYWLTLKIGDENASELSPRQQFSAVPYALNAVQFYDELKTSIDGNRSELTNSLSQIADNLENNSSKLETISINLDRNASSFNSMKSNIEANLTRVSNLENNVSNLDSRILSNVTNLTNLGSKLESNSSAIVSLNSNLVNLIQDFNSSKTIIDHNLSNRMITADWTVNGKLSKNKLESNLSADMFETGEINSTEFLALNNISSNIQEQFDNLVVKLESNETRFDNFETSIATQIENNRSALSQNISSVRSDFDGNLSRVSNLENNVSSLSSRISTNANDISELDLNVSNLDSRINSTNNRVSNLENNVTNLDSRILSNVTSLSNLGSKLESNSSAIVSLNSNLVNLKTNFDNNVDFVTLSLNNMTTFVDNLDDVVKELNASRMITANWDSDSNGKIDVNKTEVDLILNRGNVTQTGTNALALGKNSSALGTYSLAMGSFALATTDMSIAIGDGVGTFGGSVAFGRGSKAIGYTSTAMGHYTKADQNYMTAIGSGNQDNISNALFVVGNGKDLNTNRVIDDSERNNSFVVTRSKHFCLWEIVC